MERAGTADATNLGDKTVTTLRLQQPLWTGGRLDGNLDKAQALAQVAVADLEITRQQVALRVLQAWSEAVAAQGKVAVYEQSRDVHARLLTLVERRTLEGASSRADIDLARGRLDGLQADLATARAQRDTALEKLHLLSNHRLSTGELGDIFRASIPAQNRAQEALLAPARELSPQLVRARAQSRVAQAEAAIAKAALSPEVYWRAERQYGNFTVPDQAPQNRFMLGIATAWGGGLSSLSGIDAALARQRAAQEDIQTQQLALDEQVLSDVLLSRSAEQRRASLESVRQSSSEVYTSWERQFLAGRKQWQELMNAAREQAQNDAQLADAIASQLLTGWRLSLLTQGVTAMLDMYPSHRISATPAQ